MTRFEPELGQALSGNAWNEIPMQPGVEAGLVALGQLIAARDGDETGFDQNPALNSGASFANDTFVMRAYCWDECECALDEHVANCPVAAPNFACGDFEARWYKHVGRGNSQSQLLTAAEWLDIYTRCVASLVDAR